MLVLLFFFFEAVFASSCPSTLPQDAVGISRVNATCFAGLSYLKLQQVPAAACAGFTLQQLAKMGTVSPYDTCEGFSADCISNIKDVSSFSSRCLLRMAPSAAPGFSSAQLNSLINVPSLRDLVLQALKGPQCTGLNAQFLSLLGSNPSIPQCQSLSNACFAAIPDLAGMSEGCFSTIISESSRCAYLSDSQLRHLPLKLAVLLTAPCLGNVTNCQNLPWKFLGASCAGVTPDCIAASSLHGLAPPCSSSFVGASCRGINANNVRQLPLSDTALSLDCIGNLTASACQNAESSLWKIFLSNQCAALSSDCLTAVPSFDAFTLQCTLGLPEARLKVLSAKQILSFSSAGFSAFSGAMYATLVKQHGASFVGNATLQQLSSPRANAASDFVVLSSKNGFPAPTFSFSNRSFGAGATWLQVSWSTNGKEVVENNIHEVPPVSLSGLRPTQGLSRSTLHAMSASQLSYLSCVELKSLSKEDLQVIASPKFIVWPRLVQTNQYLAFDLSTVWIPLWRANREVLNNMYCDAVKALPDVFWEPFLDLVTLTAARNRYLQWRAVGCSSKDYNPATDIPCSGWRQPVDLIISSTTFTAAPTTAAPTTAPPRVPWSRKQIIIVASIAVGVVVLIVLVIVIAVIVIRKRRLATIPYTPLNSLANEVDLGAEW